MFQRLRAALQEMLTILTRNFENLQQTTQYHFTVLMEQTHQTITSIGVFVASQSQKFIQISYQNLSILWQKVIELIRIQNHKIKATTNDFGPYLPDENINHPQTFNIIHEIVVNLAGIPMVVLVTILWHFQAGLNTILNNYGFWLGLISQKNKETLNPNRFSATIHYLAKVLAACIIFGPSILILGIYQVLSLPIGLLHGTNLSQVDWRNQKIKALSHFSYTLGYVFADTIKGFFLGFFEGFSRIRHVAYRVPDAEYTMMQTIFSYLSYRLGLAFSGLVGLLSLSFDVLILGSLAIVTHSLAIGTQFIYPNQRANAKLKLQTWQKINPIWGLTPFLLILSVSINFSLRMTLSLIMGSLQGIVKGLANEFPDMNLLPSKTYIDALFNLTAQILQKAINLTLIFVLYALTYNVFRHFAQGIILAFDQILPSHKLEKNICGELNPLEKYNFLSRAIGIISGFITGLGIFFSARLGFSTLKGISYGLINGFRLSLYLPPLLTKKTTHGIDNAFNFIADGLEVSLITFIQGFSQVIVEGILINPIRLSLQGIQNGFNDILPSKRVFLIDNNIHDLKITHVFTYILGYPSYFITYNAIFLTIATLRFLNSATNGLFYGLINGLKIGFDVKVNPFEKKAHEHPIDEFFSQNFKIFTTLSLYIGTLIGSIAYNLPAILAGTTYIIRQIYADIDSVKNALDFNHTHKSRGFLGFGMGYIIGLIIYFPLVCLRLLSNSILSFYYRFMEMVALAFQGSDWQEKLKPNDLRSELARKFGIPGNIGLIFGLLAFAMIISIRKVPGFIYRNFTQGFLSGFNPWLNSPEKYKIKTILNLLPHVAGRVIGNLIGFSYQNIASLGWLIRQIIDLAYFDKPKYSNTNVSSLNNWQKWPGRTLAALLYVPLLSLLAPILTWRLIQSNCQNLIFSIKKGYQMMLGLNPQFSGFEKMLALPSYMIGFTLGFLVSILEQGLQQLTKLPRLLVNNFRHGLHLGLKPFVDKTNLIKDKPYQYLGLPLVVIGLIMGLIIGVLNNAQLATRYSFNLANALAYFDKDAKSDDDFAAKSGLRQIVGHLTTLPLSLMLIPSILLSLNAWRFIKTNVISVPQGLNDGYALKTSQNTSMSYWEAFLSLPSYSLSFILGMTVRGLKFLSIDAFISTFNGIFAGFKLIDRNYPARFLQIEQVATKAEDKSNPIAFYTLGLPVGALLKFISNITSRNLENIFISSSFWYQLLWADKRQHPKNHPAYFEPLAFPGILLGLGFGLIYFNLRGMSRVVVETFSGFTQGITNDLAARDALNPIEKSLSTPGFYLGLGVNQLGNGFIEIFKKTFATIANVSMLPYGISDHQAFKANGLAQGIGIGLGSIIATLPLVLVSGYRFIKENIKSLKAIPSLLMRDEYPLEPERQFHEQYGIGFIGTGLGYIAFTCKYLLLASISSFAYCIIAAYKLVTITKNPRFTTRVNQTLGADEKNVHLLYEKLNNFYRQFPETTEVKQFPCRRGGKGFWAFIGKVINFNNPSLTERMLDAVLEKFIENKRTTEDITSTLNLFKPAQNSHEFNHAFICITTGLEAKNKLEL